VGHSNLLAGWVGIVLGFVAGALPGLFFWREEWLGGYGSWQRRMIRLGHISFFGLGLINILFSLTVVALGLSHSRALAWSSALLIAGAVAMPLVCYLAAWRMSLRQLFPIPVACLVSGVVILTWLGFLQ
jgi:hypothetical protein